MKSLLCIVLLAACAHPAPPASPRNAADTLVSAETPDIPHGAVGERMAVAVVPNQAGDVFEVCYSLDGKHTVCFDPVASYIARERAAAEAKQKQAEAAQAKAPPPAPEPAKVEAPKKGGK